MTALDAPKDSERSMKTLTIAVLSIVILTFCPENVKADTVDNFQIYVRNVLRMNEGGFGTAQKGINLLIFTTNNDGDSLSINYNHCVAGATQRRIKLITKSEVVLFEWNFPDKERERFMHIPIRQLLPYLQIKPDSLLALSYFDDDLPLGRLLTFIKSTIEK
jgi:hypothetical protein